MMTKQSFLRGAFILMVAGMVTKALGVVNKMVLARIIGEEGMGLYMMAYPTLILTVALTQLGLPVAISKMVAEANALDDRRKIKRILTVSFSVVGALSVLFTTALMIGAPIFAKYLFTDTRTLYPLMAIAPIVPIVGVASVLRGYFQGIQNMTPYALSMVIEQIVRISLVAWLANSLLPYGIEYAAGGAMISGVIGELISLLYMIGMFKVKKRIKIRANFWSYLGKGKETFNQLMNIALPTTGSRLIGSFSYFLEPIVIAQSLALAGITTVLATKQYGELAGFAIPLLTLPSFITHSLHVSLVPTISEAAAKDRMHVIHFRINQALKIAMVAGGLSIVISYIFAEPIMELMYHSPQSAVYVHAMAPFFFLFYFQAPLAAVLQALDLAKAAMINSFIGAFVKIVTIFALASRPELGIMGAALGYAIGVVLVTLLNLASVIKSVGFSLVVMDYVKGAFACLLTGIFASFCYSHLWLNLGMLSRTLALITLSIIFYIFIIIFIKLVKRNEMEHLPLIGKWLT
jgi:stage V sporulation protein B